MKSEPTAFVVDDDTGVLNSLAWLICQAGIPVQTFSSGREFLAAYRPESPGCLLLDLRMPGMSGLEVQEDYGLAASACPSFLITSHGDIPTCSNAFRKGAFEFLEKPLNADTLIARIQNRCLRDAEQRKYGSPAHFESRLNRPHQTRTRTDRRPHYRQIPQTHCNRARR